MRKNRGEKVKGNNLSFLTSAVCTSALEAKIFQSSVCEYIIFESEFVNVNSHSTALVEAQGIVKIKILQNARSMTVKTSLEDKPRRVL